MQSHYLTLACGLADHGSYSDMLTNEQIESAATAWAAEARLGITDQVVTVTAELTDMEDWTDRVSVQVTRPVSYRVTVSDPGGSTDEDYDDRPSASDVDDLIDAHMSSYDSDASGGLVEVSWVVERLVGRDSEVIGSGDRTVYLAPEHEQMIYRAMHAWYADRPLTRDDAAALLQAHGCALSADDHDWSSEGEGGLEDNPGVWSTGGTSLLTREHCTRCGLHRESHYLGSQRNPGEADTVEYWLGERD